MCSIKPQKSEYPTSRLATSSEMPPEVRRNLNQPQIAIQYGCSVSQHGVKTSDRSSGDSDPMFSCCDKWSPQSCTTSVITCPFVLPHTNCRAEGCNARLRANSANDNNRGVHLAFLTRRLECHHFKCDAIPTAKLRLMR